MKVSVNGREKELGAGTQLVQLLDELGLDPRYLVVEYNGQPLGRGRFGEVTLREGDRLELVRPVAGG